MKPHKRKPDTQKRHTRKILLAITAAAAALTGSLSAQAVENVKRTFCLFDIVGKAGPIYSAFEEYRLEALKWGVDLQIKPFTDERVTVEEFKGGTCDAVGVTGIRARAFNSFTGTLDSLASIPDYEHMRVVLEKLASPQIASLMRVGEYEVAGIGPAGSAYLLTNDRSIDTIQEVAGKRIAVLDFDKSQAEMAQNFGASPVTVSIATIGSMFNNGAVDIIGAPAVAFEPLELYKGIGEKGGIVNFSLAQLTIQLLIRHEKFPAGYGQKSREFIYGQYDRTMDAINTATNSIDKKYWMNLPEKDLEGYREVARQSRLSLRDKGYYDAKMLTFLSRVRCQMTPSLTECTAKDRE